MSLLVARRHIQGKAAALIGRCGGAPVYTAEDDLLENLTGYQLTRGVLCAMRRPAPRSAFSRFLCGAFVIHFRTFHG